MAYFPTIYGFLFIYFLEEGIEIQGNEEIKVSLQSVHRITSCPWIAVGYTPKELIII